METPVLVEGWMPPTRENWEQILWVWKVVYPLFGSMQWLVSWYGMGKTSVTSKLNLPGRFAWLTMECPGFLTMLYVMNTLPGMHGIEDLPWQNKVLAGLYVLHYMYRCVIFPFIAPSMSPIHFFVWSSAMTFQCINATALSSWLAAYGPTTAEEWTSSVSIAQFSLGLLVFYAGLAGNFFHDEELREIRRREQRRRDKLIKEQGGRKQGVDKVYKIPEAGLFRYMLYPHYLCEWVEWTGFWIACGSGCVPARTFVVNEIAVMLPRAIRGKWWYQDTFGNEKVGKRWAVLPGLC